MNFPFFGVAESLTKRSKTFLRLGKLYSLTFICLKYGHIEITLRLSQQILQTNAVIIRHVNCQLEPKRAQ
jgi:hypothetical protein